MQRVGILHAAGDDPLHGLEGGVPDLPLVSPLLARLDQQPTDVHGAGADQTFLLRCRTDSADNLGEREVLLVELVDQIEQSLRVPGRESRHLSSVPRAESRETNGTVPKGSLVAQSN